MEEISEDTCYVCLEGTEERSPCECAHPLHRKCLLNAQKYNSTCTICRNPFKDPKPRHSASALLLYLFILRNIIRILIFVSGYLVMGITGQLFLASTGYQTVLLSHVSSWTAIFSVEFATCAIVVGFFLTMCYILLHNLNFI